MTFYSNPGLLVETYDVSCPDTGDIDFLVGKARETGGPVLELACGTGRVVWPLAEAGFDVFGIDVSRPMLDVAEAKRDSHAAEVARRVRLVEGDMARYEFPERFGLVFSTFRSFQALLTPERQREALDCAHRHLRPGGILVLDLFDPILRICEQGDVGRVFLSSTFRHPESGNDVVVDAQSRLNDPLRQVCHETWRLTERDAEGKMLREEVEILDLRWTYRFEMRYLLQLCGYEVLSEYSDFAGSPPAYAREQVWVARRP